MSLNAGWAPHTPQQNGQSERKYRSLLDKARCLMLEAKIPEKLWAEANILATILSTEVLQKH